MGCADLSISPTTADLGVDDVFDNTNFRVTATATDGSNITSDSEFTYSAYKYGTATSATPDADGDIRYGFVGNGGNGAVSTSDSTIEYEDSEPGDQLCAYVSDYDGVDYDDICEVCVQFPYCTDLDVLNPIGSLPAPGPYEADVEIDVDSSTGEDWPYDVTYESTDSNATFDGNTTPYTTDDWTVAYYGEEEGSQTVSVGLDDENGDGESDDVAGLCSDDFSYTIEEPEACLYLEITVPTSEILTCEEMGVEIEITWTSVMTDGLPASGPWVLTSSNGSGEFRLVSGGAIIGTGTAVSPVTTVYYTGEPGDTITVTDLVYPTCTDRIDSETCEEVVPVCEDLSLSDPYIINDDGSTGTIDLTDDSDLALLYDETVVCWDYTLAVSDASYSGTLMAEGFTDNTQTTYNGNLSIEVNETGGTDVGNPASEGVTGFTNYTGTICWENFEEGNYLSVSMLGDELTCSDTEEFPPLEVEEAPYCVDLELDPDSFTMSASDADAGTMTLTIEVEGSDSSWTGNLIVETTGSGELFYTDGSASTFGDGHLEIPVTGTSTTVTVTYVGGNAGDTLTAYIEDEEGSCTDNLSITQQPAVEAPVCVSLALDPDSYTLDADDEEAEEIESTVTVEGSGSGWTGTLIVEADGEGDLFYSDGDPAESNGTLEIAVSGTFTTVTFTYEDGVAGDTVSSYIEDEELLCADEYTLDQEEKEEVCIDVLFDENELDTMEGEDETMEITVDTERESEDINITYDCPDDEGTIVFEGDEYEGDLTIENVEDGETVEVTFENLCEGADISVEAEGQEEVCSDTLDVEIVEMGTFEKFIFTFNFATDKNFEDEGVFFAHNEDRAFYTLQYTPSGDEEDAITFTDDMWRADLLGTQGGSVSLATTYDELTKGNAFDYGTITKMGFGSTHELYSDTIASQIDGTQVFVPYLKYDNNSESTLIEECTYADDELTSEDVCYDPDNSPETTGYVVIENADTVNDASIRIRYVGVIFTGLDCDDTTDECLTEEFDNEANVEVFEGFASLEAEAKLVVLCSYLMTQNAGDVYLEVELNTGSDISCIFVDEETASSESYANSDALVILENDDGSSGSAYRATYASESISFCDSDSDNTLVGNISSYICEIVNTVTELWKRSTVETTTESRVSQATRNAETNQATGTNGPYDWNTLVSTFSNKNNPDSNILYFNGALSSTGILVLNDLTITEGAWTVIVENADLRIEGNILYGSTGSYADIPSVAFVVLGGDIDIDNTVGDLVGVYYTDQAFTGDLRSAVNEQLTVNGSLYGNVEALLEAAQYVGPPTIDGGGLVIKYDSRILLNTPPGLSEYVDVNTENAVN